MAIDADGAFVGSVSGGCVEGAVIQEAGHVLESRRPKLLEFGVDDERAWSVGLTCGGKIQVLLELFPLFSDDPAQQEAGALWLDRLERGLPLTITSRIDQALVEVDIANSVGKSGLVTSDDELVFVHHVRGLARLLIIGATDIATHLVRLARQFDFEITVVDPRPAFSDVTRFDPTPDRVLTAWPGEALTEDLLTADTFGVLLSHKPGVDDPALHRFLDAGIGYIGALGSRKTQEKRRQRLADDGFSQDQIDRIHGPVGLDIGAANPAEIALSIMAQIIAVRNSTD
jgi:xanthine dehydrogenase accessory factor